MDMSLQFIGWSRTQINRYGPTDLKGFNNTIILYYIVHYDAHTQFITHLLNVEMSMPQTLE